MYFRFRKVYLASFSLLAIPVSSLILLSILQELIPKVTTKNCAAANCSNNESTCTLFRFPKVKYLVNKEVVVNRGQLER